MTYRFLKEYANYIKKRAVYVEDKDYFNAAVDSCLRKAYSGQIILNEAMFTLCEIERQVNNAKYVF